ncbi:MAG TPA: helix-turn-helix transcriptional regulator [Bacilli bacterium]|nr:helix-turn-helix transcriptional regulator [Bacilli bacterium]
MNAQKIGSFISALRRAKGLTQQQLADLFHVSNKTVSKWECGNALPEITVLMALGEYFEVSVDEILQGERKETGKNLAVDTELKKQKARLNYFYKKRISQLNIFSIVSYALLIISVSLLVIFFSLQKYGLALGLGIPLFVIGICLFFIGVTTVRNNAEEELDSKHWRLFSIELYKMTYIFINIIMVLIIAIMQLQNMPSLVILGLGLVVSPFYYYFIKHRLFEIPMPNTVQVVAGWVTLIKPAYVLATLVTIIFVFFTPLYTIGHYTSSHVLVEGVTGSFWPLIFDNPDLWGLYAFLFVFLVGIGLAIFSYLKKNLLWVSYLIQAVATSGLYMVMYGQYLIDYDYFQTTYDSVNSSLNSFLPFTFYLVVLGLIDLGHRILIHQIKHKKAKPLSVEVR